MSSSIFLYNSLMKYLANGTINLETDTIKLMLLTSAHTPSLLHDVRADVQASPDPEVAAVASPNNGYTAGGKALTGQTWTLTDSPPKCVFDAADLTWTALTATFRYGVLYAAKTVGSPAIVNPLIGYILFNSTPADIVVSGVDWLCQWDAAGIFDLAKAE